MNLPTALIVLRQHAEARMIEAALTERQIEVARLLLRGFTTHEIGSYLRISSRTAASHLEAIFTKFGVASRVALYNHLFPVYGEPGA